MDEIQSPAPAQKPKRKTVTSSAVKKRYNDKTYKNFSFVLRLVDDSELLNFIESKRLPGESDSALIKSILYEYFNGGK